MIVFIPTPSNLFALKAIFIFFELETALYDYWVMITIYSVRPINCYRAIALKLLIISKNVSDKSFIVREGRHTRPPYFFIGGGAKATSRSTPPF